MKATPTLVLLLLLGSLGFAGCSKKDDPDPAPNTASYSADGRSVTAGFVRAFYQGPGNAGTDDRLTIQLTTSNTAPGVNAEVVTLIFNKAPSTPESAYQVQLLHLTQGPSKPYYFYTDKVVATLKKTSTGGYSGTFSGVAPASTAYPSGALTQGVFTDVKL